MTAAHQFEDPQRVEEDAYTHGFEVPEGYTRVGVFCSSAAPVPYIAGPGVPVMVWSWRDNGWARLTDAGRLS